MAAGVVRCLRGFLLTCLLLAWGGGAGGGDSVACSTHGTVQAQPGDEDHQREC
jgi:hypothetical protein